MISAGWLAFLVQLVPLTIVCALLIPPYWLIFKRLGRAPALAFCTLIPLGIFVLPFVVATLLKERQRSA